MWWNVSKEAGMAVRAGMPAHTETAMSSPRLAAELLDHVVDYLHNSEDALRKCCLVSKSWVPRARKYLFADIWFGTEEDLEWWLVMFPDPSTSPARYTKILTIDCPKSITIADGEGGGWVRSFSHVVELELRRSSRLPGTFEEDESGTFLTLLQGLSPFVKILTIDCIGLPSSRIFDLTLSFPLLEDLTLTGYGYTAADEDDGSNGPPVAAQPSNLPVFTGSFKLETKGLVPIARQLLSLPSGIHFRKLTLMWDRGEDISSIAALVEGCSHTLESLDIGCNPPGVSIQHLRPY